MIKRGFSYSLPSARAAAAGHGAGTAVGSGRTASPLDFAAEAEFLDQVTREELKAALRDGAEAGRMLRDPDALGRFLPLADALRVGDGAARLEEVPLPPDVAAAARRYRDGGEGAAAATPRFSDMALEPTGPHSGAETADRLGVERAATRRVLAQVLAAQGSRLHVETELGVALLEIAVAAKERPANAATSTVLVGAKWAKRTDLVDRVLALPASMPDALGVHHYTQAVNAYVRAGQREGALRAYDKALGGLAVEPDSHLLAHVLGACMDTAFAHRAFPIAHEAVRRGAVVQPEHLTALLHCARMAGDASQVHAWTGAAFDSDAMAAPRVQYAALLAKAAVAGMEEASRTLRRLMDEGHPLGVPAFEALLRAAASTGDVVASRDVWAAMHGMGVAPNSVTVVFHLSALRRHGLWQEAEGVLAEAEEQATAASGPPHPAAYMMVAAAYREAGDTDGALAVVERMRARGVRLDMPTLHTAVSAALDVGRAEDAEQLVADAERDHGLRPDLPLVTRLATHYAEVGSWDRVGRALAGLQRRGVAPDAYLVEKLARAADVAGAVFAGPALAALAREHALPLSPRAWAALVSLHVDPQPEQALQVYEQALDTAGGVSALGSDFVHGFAAAAAAARHLGMRERVDQVAREAEACLGHVPHEVRNEQAWSAWLARDGPAVIRLFDTAIKEGYAWAQGRPASATAAAGDGGVPPPPEGFPVHVLTRAAAVHAQAANAEGIAALADAAARLDVPPSALATARGFAALAFARGGRGELAAAVVEEEAARQLPEAPASWWPLIRAVEALAQRGDVAGALRLTRATAAFAHAATLDSRGDDDGDSPTVGAGAEACRVTELAVDTVLAEWAVQTLQASHTTYSRSDGAGEAHVMTFDAVGTFLEHLEEVGGAVDAHTACRVGRAMYSTGCPGRQVAAALERMHAMSCARASGGGGAAEGGDALGERWVMWEEEKEGTPAVEGEEEEGSHPDAPFTCLQWAPSLTDALRRKDAEGAVALAESAQRRGVPVDGGFIGQSLRARLMAGRAEEVAASIERGEALAGVGGAEATRAVNALLAAAVEDGKGVRRLWQAAEGAGVGADEYTVNLLCRAWLAPLALAREAEAGEQLQALLARHGVQPTGDALAPLFSAAPPQDKGRRGGGGNRRNSDGSRTQAGCPPRLAASLMQAAGLEPSPRQYTLLLGAQQRTEEVEQAVGAIAPTALSPAHVNAALRALSRLRDTPPRLRMTASERIVERCAAQGVRPGPQGYMAMLSQAQASRDWTAVGRVLQNALTAAGGADQRLLSTAATALAASGAPNELVTAAESASARHAPLEMRRRLEGALDALLTGRAARSRGGGAGGRASSPRPRQPYNRAAAGGAGRRAGATARAGSTRAR